MKTQIKILKIETKRLTPLRRIIFYFLEHRLMSKACIWLLLIFKVHRTQVAAKIPFAGIFTFHYEGFSKPLKLSAAADDNLVSQIFWGALLGDVPEVRTLEYMKEILPTIDTFIDIGAHVGFLSLSAIRFNPKVKVIALEPQPAVFNRLTYHNEINETQIDCIHNALSDSQSRRTFYTFHEIPSSSGFVPEKIFTENLEVEQFTVETRTLDQWVEVLDDHTKILIKIDVEGHEFEVLTGGEQFISKFRPVIISEILDNLALETLETFLANHNYSIVMCLETGLTTFTRGNFLLLPNEYNDSFYLKDIQDFR